MENKQMRSIVFQAPKFLQGLLITNYKARNSELERSNWILSRLPLTPPLLALSLLLAVPPPALIAGTCAALTSCGSPPMQFVPGQPVSIEVVNLTYIPVFVQQVGKTDSFSIASRQSLYVLRGSTVSPNFSLIFWTGDGGTLQASVSQPAPQVLRIEIRASRARGNNAVYLKDNGQVEVF